jgi:hypothetical protein
MSPFTFCAEAPAPRGQPRMSLTTLSGYFTLHQIVWRYG